MLSLRQIEVVRAVMLARSIAGAARMLHVAPAGVSRMLKHTEMLAGFRMFTRTSDGFVPSPEAKELFEDLETVHRAVTRINRRVEAAGRSTEAAISVGVSPGLGLSLAPKVLKAMTREIPDLRFRLDVLHIDEVVPRLLHGANEVALTIYAVDDPRVASRSIATADLVCLVARDHPLAGMAGVSLADVARYPFIGFDESSFQQKMIDELLARNATAVDYAARVRLMVTACALVREGLGVTLLDAFTVCGEPPGGTVAVPLQSDIRFPLNAVSNPQKPLSQECLRFLDIVAEVAGATRQPGPRPANASADRPHRPVDG